MDPGIDVGRPGPDRGQGIGGGQAQVFMGVHLDVQIAHGRDADLQLRHAESGKPPGDGQLFLQ